MSRAHWVLFLDQITPGKVSIRQPFARNSYSLPLNFPNCINLLDFHAFELCRFYNISRLDPKRNTGKPISWFDVVLKVVLVCNVGVVVLSNDGKLGLLRLKLGLEKPECNVSEVGSRKGRMYAGFSLNLDNVGGNSEWETLHSGKGYEFDDIVEFKGALLGIDRRGRVHQIDIGLVSGAGVSIKVIVPSIWGGAGRRKRLVESLGKLYLVERAKIRKGSNVIFKVYELNEHTKKWVKVKSLGDQTFVVGLEFSFSISSDDFHGGCVKNCILFKQRSFLKYSGYDDDGALFEKLERSDLNVAVWHMEDAAHLGVVETQPGYSDALWPPPCWFWPIDMIQRVENTVMFQLQMRIPLEKLKAMCNELSQTRQEDAPTLMKLVIAIEDFQSQTNWVEDQWKQLCTDLLSLQHSQSLDQDDQAEISTLGTEERRMSFAAIKKFVSEHNPDFDWYSMERKMNICMNRLEESASGLENSHKSLFCTLTDLSVA